jgi:hypothetical protein
LAVLSTWLGPKLIGWYVTPADQPALLTCQAAVMGAMRRLVDAQLVCTAVGAVAGLVASFFLFKPREAEPAPAPAPASAPAPAAKK